MVVNSTYLAQLAPHVQGSIELTITFDIGSPVNITIIISASPSPIFGGGQGTISKPYQISTAQHLQELMDYPDSHFIQTTNIDLSGIEWIPIGYNSSNPGHPHQFNGVYDGNNLTISGLAMDYADQNYTCRHQKVILGDIGEEINQQMEFVKCQT